MYKGIKTGSCYRRFSVLVVNWTIPRWRVCDFRLPSVYSLLYLIVFLSVRLAVCPSIFLCAFWTYFNFVHLSISSRGFCLFFLSVGASVCPGNCLPRGYRVCQFVFQCRFSFAHVWMTVYRFVYLSVRSSVCLSVCPRFCLSICLFASLTTFLAMCEWICMGAYLSTAIYLFACLSTKLFFFIVNLSGCMSVRVSVWLPFVHSHICVYTNLCVHAFIVSHLFVCTYVCLSDCMKCVLVPSSVLISIRMSVRMSVHVSVRPSVAVRVSVSPSVCLITCLSVQPYVWSRVCLSIRMSTWVCLDLYPSDSLPDWDFLPICLYSQFVCLSARLYVRASDFRLAFFTLAYLSKLLKLQSRLYFPLSGNMSFSDAGLYFKVSWAWEIIAFVLLLF